MFKVTCTLQRTANHAKSMLSLPTWCNAIKSLKKPYTFLWQSEGRLTLLYGLIFFFSTKEDNKGQTHTKPNAEPNMQKWMTCLEPVEDQSFIPARSRSKTMASIVPFLKNIFKEEYKEIGNIKRLKLHSMQSKICSLDPQKNWQISNLI